MKPKTSFFKTLLGYLRQTSIMLLFILILFCSVSSFASAFVSTDYYSFSNALNENKESLVDRRIIFGLKDGLAKKNADNSEQKKIGLRGAITSYGVGVNSDEDSFSISSTTITPIESNLLSYIWSNVSEPNFLIQYVPVNRLLTDVSFDDKTNNIFISKKLYLQLENPSDIYIYSYVLEEAIPYKVVGYYDNESVNRLQSVFYNVYQEPVFFNHTGFKSLYGGKEDYFSNIQTDIIFSGDAQYNDVVYNIFSEKHWKNSFVKYGLFENVFIRMDQLNNRKTTSNILFGCAFFFLLIVITFIFVRWFRAALVDSIVFCNPFILICLWGASIFAVFGLSKLLKTQLFFFEPSVGIVLSIAVVFMIIQTVIYFYFRNKKKGLLNE